jgi:hypothetical protein
MLGLWGSIVMDVGVLCVMMWIHLVLELDKSHDCSSAVLHLDLSISSHIKETQKHRRVKAQFNSRACR